MIPLSLSWSVGVVLCWISLWPELQSALSPENEVPLRPTTWLPEGKITHVRLPKGKTVRLYFTLKKKTSGMSLTVSPCDLRIEWSLTARTLKDKPFKSLQWMTKKSTPEVWWRGPGNEEKIHSFSGNSLHTYSGPTHFHASIYILRLRSKLHNSKATVFLHEGKGPSGAFPLLPNDTTVHTLGVGMTSVTLNWSPSPSLTSQKGYEYCVLVNSQNNYPSLCAAQDSIQRKSEVVQNRNEKKRGMTPWPILKEWWWEQWDSYPDSKDTDKLEDFQCVCKGAENVCTVSELLPDTQYYFDVFVMDKLNRTSVAYRGSYARTHEEARADITTLREGELRWVNFPDRSFNSEQFFNFRPQGWQQSGLLTLQSCGRDEQIKVIVSSKGEVLETQKIGGELVQIWLQGSPSYLIHLEREGTPSKKIPLPAGLTASVKMQTSSAYHKRAVPSLPSTLQIKSFNKLRTCNSVTIAWMGTEERSLYCVYRRKLDSQEESGKALALNTPCLGPESRSDTERVLCKYFQELNPRRAVTTAVISGLEPGMAYVFDVYLMRRWGIPIKYTSKMVKTRRDC
ncbi:unnamed protein product [Knipowitschia caucasica]|uniref:Protein NDNF n=1 Tax=Knipowitschia caucasica TaxID=637954 RepID=A0AAV2JQT3_KNICA